MAHGGPQEQPHVLAGMLAMAQISELRVASHVNTVLALAAAGYLGVNVVCIVINSCDLDDPETAVTTLDVYHRLEFWSTFLFNVVSVLALFYSPGGSNRTPLNPVFLKLAILVNVASSFVSALMVTIALEAWEVPAHEIEYSNELTMAIVDLALLLPLLRGLGRFEGRASAIYSAGMVVVALCIATVQLAIYNGMGFEDGEPKGEKIAHYFEFAFGIVSSIITFWSTINGKLLADGHIAAILKLDAPKAILEAAA